MGNIPSLSTKSMSKSNGPMVPVLPRCWARSIDLSQVSLTAQSPYRQREVFPGYSLGVPALSSNREVRGKTLGRPVEVAHIFRTILVNSPSLSITWPQLVRTAASMAASNFRRIPCTNCTAVSYCCFSTSVNGTSTGV